MFAALFMANAQLSSCSLSLVEDAIGRKQELNRL